MSTSIHISIKSCLLHALIMRCCFVSVLLRRLSQDSLKTFLSHEVLEKYSFLFKQKTENSAPDGSGLEPWLQALLGQMQTSIEQHVNSAMDGSSL